MEHVHVHVTRPSGDQQEPLKIGLSSSCNSVQSPSQIWCGFPESLCGRRIRHVSDRRCTWQAVFPLPLAHLRKSNAHRHVWVRWYRAVSRLLSSDVAPRSSKCWIWASRACGLRPRVVMGWAAPHCTLWLDVPDPRKTQTVGPIFCSMQAEPSFHLPTPHPLFPAPSTFLLFPAKDPHPHPVDHSPNESALTCEIL